MGDVVSIFTGETLHVDDTFSSAEIDNLPLEDVILSLPYELDGGRLTFRRWTSEWLACYFQFPDRYHYRHEAPTVTLAARALLQDLQERDLL